MISVSAVCRHSWCGVTSRSTGRDARTGGHRYGRDVHYHPQCVRTATHVGRYFGTRGARPHRKHQARAGAGVRRTVRNSWATAHQNASTRDPKSCVEATIKKAPPI